MNFLFYLLIIMGNKSSNKLIKNEQQYNNIDDEDGDYSFCLGIHPPSLMNYKFSGRRIRYYTEKMEISDEEQKYISSLKSDLIEFYEFPDNKEKTIKVIIDTDIGTDWDDSMAISYALHLPNIEILGITTNYGIPDLRASITQKIIDAYLKSHPNKKPINNIWS